MKDIYPGDWDLHVMLTQWEIVSTMPSDRNIVTELTRGTTIVGKRYNSVKVAY